MKIHICPCTDLEHDCLNIYRSVNNVWRECQCYNYIKFTIGYVNIANIDCYEQFLLQLNVEVVHAVWRANRGYRFMTSFYRSLSAIQTAQVHGQRIHCDVTSHVIVTTALL
jgi:hypothetical protein